MNLDRRYRTVAKIHPLEFEYLLWRRMDKFTVS